MLLLVPLFLGIAYLAVITSRKPLRRWEGLVVKHSWADIPGGWKYKSPAPADYVFDLKIGMKQHRIDELIANLMEISDPEHPRYSQHLTRDQVEQLTAPHPDSIRVIDEWLAFHDIKNMSDSARRSKAGDWVTIRVTVEQAERLLGANYNIYQHGMSGDQVVRTLSYSLPEELLPHIDVVAPTTYFSTIQSMKRTSFTAISSKGGKCLNAEGKCLTAGCVIPENLRSMYKTTDYEPQKDKTNNTIGIAGYLNQYANYHDLETFLAELRPDASGSNFTTVLINNGRNDQKEPGMEANLDIQYSIGISYPIPNIYYSTGGSPPVEQDSTVNQINNTNEPYLEFLQNLLNSGQIPQVVTTSYAENEQSVPLDYANAVCNGFATLGVMGTTVFFASGDFGVGQRDCMTNDGKNQTVFQPEFPASCPFVTAVGGTTGNPERASNFSGGGFSRYFNRPDYQSAQVTDFLNNLGNTHQGMFNPTGRAYPDLSAQAENFQVVIDETCHSVGGTSASSPTVAAIFSLLNDMLLASGKPSLGFINPLIYSNTSKSGFNDITSGNNPGCNTTGFNASTGWDPVTGLGTPNFVALKEIVNNTATT